MKESHTDEDIEKVKEKAIQQGHEPLVINGVERSVVAVSGKVNDCLLYTSPSPRDGCRSRMPSSA